MSNTNWQERKVGALWQSKNKKGTFFSGTIDLEGETLRVIVFKNNFRDENPKAPDWVIYKSEEQGEEREDRPAKKPFYKKNSGNKYSKPAREEAPDKDVEFD